MSTSPVRVRFAPSPTGIMHIGNIRTALLNYIFAKKHNGSFILRIEDTDQKRNFDPGAQQILQDLAWLNLSYNEGPRVGGPHAPYFQSERTAIYQEQLAKLIAQKLVYRCFCTEEVLEKKRERAIALKQAPRYDQTCLKLTEDQVTYLLNEKTPHIWRFKFDRSKSIQFEDLARGTAVFDPTHFTDFPLTRTDGTATFLFANVIDDMLMQITHVLRGEDHFSNTVNQVALFHAFGAPVPTYWHLPIICSTSGKKLSKRDFGFSLNDLKESGFLPEAIVNYLGIIGASFAQEILSLDELVTAFDFTHPKCGSIQYDVEKLRWVNNQWISKATPDQLEKLVAPYVYEAYPEARTLEHATLIKLITMVQPELATTRDIVNALEFYFSKPTLFKALFTEHIAPADLDKIVGITTALKGQFGNPEQFVESLKKQAKEEKIPAKAVFVFLRLALTGQIHGQTMNDLLALLTPRTVEERITAALDCLRRVE